ncbi:hypothetical protein K3722_00415 [Leisingera caerulea]|uniref:Uncharacterized protein n=1 Tax=Leisingera caerulea TaxID=506591 RepID=A0ABY5WWJ5_LEICA|nr:hypothetical protein [Leisingera caerulea]UWQ58632.1 hypothetical protein K3722_00415 [Leisingera caerulea]
MTKSRIVEILERDLNHASSMLDLLRNGAVIKSGDVETAEYREELEERIAKLEMRIQNCEAIEGLPKPR